MSTPSVAPELAARPYFPALTGIRAVAAWMIFFFHANPFPEYSVPWRLAHGLNSGVGLFFVLSGLLIGSRYLGRVELAGRWLATYLWRRFARIYPLYFLLTCAALLTYALAPQYDTAGMYGPFTPKGRLLLIGLNLTLLRGLFTEFRFMGIMQAWSLTVEECFYGLAPWLLVGLGRRGPLVLLGYAAGLLAAGCALVALPPAWHRYGFFGSYSFMLWGTLPGRCLEFLAGLYLAWWLHRHPAASGPAAGARRAPYTWLGLGWLLATIGLIAYVDSPGPHPATAAALLVLLNNVVLVPGCCLLFYGLVREPSGLRRVLASRLFKWLGASSYAFYLLHHGILQQLIGQYVSQRIAVRFVLTNLAALLLYQYLERPAHRWLAGRNACD